jgi:hypothetical protein
MAFCVARKLLVLVESEELFIAKLGQAEAVRYS